MAPTPEDHYPPEIIVLLSSNVPNPASNVFCDRIIQIEEHIPTTKGPNEKDDTRTPCLQAWDDNCGWTKLRLFGLEGAMTQYYIFMPIVWCWKTSAICFTSTIRPSHPKRPERQWGCWLPHLKFLHQKNSMQEWCYSVYPNRLLTKWCAIWALSLRSNWYRQSKRRVANLCLKAKWFNQNLHIPWGKGKRLPELFLPRTIVLSSTTWIQCPAADVQAAKIL